ncbi:flagellar hook-length control protein FliK [Methylophaga sp.]|uniref:flagellar hook-length control protein FliK n=1 Tax=Methylophaga sp. TaxID=2024840 RepID=UPI0013FE99D0|nr:flagellar hook-length control protein FliK [Methylophaga sp.]MTI63785.1 hypothetical protein [Methylophaga sp.]
MPQPVMIQTEPVSAVSARKNAVAGNSTDKSAFSAEFEQRIEQGQAANNRAKSDKNQAAKSVDNEQNVAADGNKLPAEDDSNSVSEAQSDSETHAESDAEQQAGNHSESAAEPKEVDQATDSSAADNSGQETVVVAPGQAADSAKNTDVSNKKADKPVRAQVSVSQQAVDNAKTTSVEMTAKAHPKQTEAVTADTVPSNTKATQQTAAKTISESIEKLNGEEQQRAQKATPNLAAALKQLSEDNAEPPKIRADILDALQRQQNKPEVTVNLRNLMAAQAQQSEAKPAVTLPPILTDRGAADTAGTALTPTSLTGLVSTQSGTNASAISQPTLSLPVQPNMQNPAWSQVMSSRVVWMAKEGVQQAELRMNPANLGPVEVRLHVQNDQASVTFLAQQGTTREALEQALPRLRESFAESGLQLANAEVGEQQHQQQEQSEQANDSHIFAQASRQDDDIDNETVESVSSDEASVGLSLYA